MAFQLIDDSLDYSSNSNKLGKNIGDDFKEGKITLPIILAYLRANNKDKKFSITLPPKFIYLYN